jgi:hypothetical protein
MLAHLLQWMLAHLLQWMLFRVTVAAWALSPMH